MIFNPLHRPPKEGAERCYVPTSKGNLLCSTSRGWSPIPASAWKFLNPEPDAKVYFLGVWGDQDCYGVELHLADDVHDHDWVNLRYLIGMLTEVEYEIASRALQIVAWDRDHQHCGRCGSKIEMHNSELAKYCQACDLMVYPRLSPCVITVLTRGDECLLAHNPAFPEKYYSALAGFIEAGETVEAALRREVKEEVGLRVGKLSYFGSQSWPFPGQLMIGFHAEYESGEIDVDGIEIVDAQWFRFDQLPNVPPPGTLSGRLIQHFVDSRRQAQES